MTRPSARFLHAAGVRLDVPVEGCGRFAAGSQAVRLRDLLAESAFQALERLVATSIELDVDFVLLGGDTFCDADASVAARGALRRALEKWAEHSTPVFVVPGSDDPADAWTRFPSLPECVTLLTPDPAGDGPHHVERGGEVVAAIEYWHQSPQARRRNPRDADGAWRIAVLADDPWQDEASLRRLESPAADYFAVAPATGRQTEAAHGAVMHSPGCTTPTRGHETSAGEATLVTLDPAKGIECEPVGLSSFARLSRRLTIDDRTTEERFLQQMRQALREVATTPPREALLVSWKVSGSGSFRQSLNDAEFQQLLFESAVEGMIRPSTSIVQHVEIEPLTPRFPRGKPGDAKTLVSKALVALECRSAEVDPDSWLRQAGLASRTAVRPVDRTRLQAAAASRIEEWLGAGTED